MRRLDEHEQGASEREGAPGHQREPEHVPPPDREEHDQHGCRGRCRHPHLRDERKEGQQQHEHAGRTPEQHGVGWPAAGWRAVPAEQSAAMRDGEDRHGDRDTHECRRPAEREEGCRVAAHALRGEQVGEVRHGEDEGCRVRQPHGGEGEGQRADAHALREEHDHRRDDHRGGVEREEHGADHGERHDGRPEQDHAAAAPPGEVLGEHVEHRIVPRQLGHDRDGDDEPHHRGDA